MPQHTPPRHRVGRGKRLWACVGILLAPLLACPSAALADGARLQREGASRAVLDIAGWIAASGDNRRLPFAIVDKVNARVYVFDGYSQLRGASPALLGLGKGDDSAPGIGERKLAAITPAERTTPAGRFEASLGHDFEQDILWVDYATALSLHRVIVGNPKDHRVRRLASQTSRDNRISYGCINVPAAFYDGVVKPAFTGTISIVYILPETRPLGEVFVMGNGLPVSAQE